MLKLKFLLFYKRYELKLCDRHQLVLDLQTSV